ncbi:MAG: dihydrodipicolinate reductase [Bacteroidota bacterium]
MKRNSPVRVVQFGFGPIGQACAREIQRRTWATLVGVVDNSIELASKSVGEVLGIKELNEMRVSRGLSSILRRQKADVVVHTTRSFLVDVQKQLSAIVRAGLPIVSSTEELFYPWSRNTRLAQKLDALAKKHRVAILATGVNPGFVMDSLVLFVSSVCTDIKAVRVERVVDAGRRRLPLQKKVGAGLLPSKFSEMRLTNRLGHIGLRESFDFVANTLRLAFDQVVETLDPVIAEMPCTTEFLSIDAGQVAGIHHVIRGSRSGVVLLELDLKMYVGAEKEFDSIIIEGTPPLHLRFEEGIHGDMATVGALVNAIPRVLSARPGLQTMKDLPLPHFFSGDVFT